MMKQTSETEFSISERVNHKGAALMTTPTFEQLNLHGFIQNAISDLNFESPSQIQFESIPKIMAGEDIIAMAPTGSGKTVAFSIPALQKIETENRNVQVLILCPTRELVIQAHKEVDKLTKYNEEIITVSIYGGQQIEKQFNALQRNPQVLIATPGRLMDHLNRGTINLDSIKIAILDEADEMLDMGFREDLHTILEQTNNERQTVLFSATMEKNIMEIAKKFQKTPFIIDVLDNLKSIPNIEQFYLELNEKDKPELITRLVDMHMMNQALVFCNTKSNVDRVLENLKGRGFRVDAIHGDMNQSQREKVMMGFQKGIVKILVATDVAGRGIDVKNLDAVFNYDLPRDDEDYIHRIGRTGRAGNSGLAFSFISRGQINALKRIERANGFKITKKECPSIEELDNIRFAKHSNEIREIALNADLGEYKSRIQSLMDENISELDIAAALYKMLTKKEQMKINRKFVIEQPGLEHSESRQKKSSSNHKRRKSSSDSKKSIKSPFAKFIDIQKPNKKSRRRTKSVR
ncbi:MAG: DEAD/DEAH box helicase [Heliobacteriaceae bacterium]|jgi:ATP-dependent RNA helicase DeaD|nr:DEAD/DEAH box helicase [Heliobacteriaceae bacterium]